MAENLWALREQKQMSVASLANRSGLPIRLIIEYEAGLRSIDPKHLTRLARVLYVEDADIKLQCDPKPGSAPLERQPARRPRRSPDSTGLVWSSKYPYCIWHVLSVPAAFHEGCFGPISSGRLARTLA